MIDTTYARGSVRTVFVCGLLLAASASCRRGDVEVFLGVDDTVRSVVLVRFVEDAATLTAHDLGDGLDTAILDPYVGAYPVEVTALLYSDPLATIDLAPGALETVSEGGRPLPAADAVQVSTIRGEDVEPWETRAAPGERVEALRIPGETAGCIEEGGCYDVDDPAVARCVVPCPDPAAPEPAFETVRPALTPCPAGYTEVAIDEDITVCDPFPAGRKTTCARGYAQFLGDADCTRVGPACPTSGFPAGIPPGARVFVAEGGTGNGTEGAPYGSIGAALAGATEGDVVVVAAGRYAESFTVPIGVTVFGACTTGTTIATTNTIVVGGTLANFYLERARVRIEAVANRAALKSVIIADSAGEAIMSRQVSGLLLEDVVVDGAAEAGIVVWRGYATIRNVVVRGATSHGYLASASEHDIEDLVIDGTRLSASNVGRGMEIQASATVTATRAWFGNQTDVAMFVDSSEATFTDLVVVGSDVTEDRAAYVQNEANLTLQRSWLHRTRGDAVRVLIGASLEMSDVVVSQTRGPSDAGAVHLESSASLLDAVRLAVLDPPYHGVVSQAPTARIADVVVRRSGSGEGAEQFGHGLLLSRVASVRGAHLSDLDGAGIVAGSSAHLDVQDAVIERPSRRGCRVCTGICTQNAEVAHLTRVRIEDAAGLAIGQGELVGGEVTASDLVVRNVKVIECDRPASSPSLGLGDGLATRGPLTLERFEIEGCANAGLSLGAGDEPSRVHVRDGFVHGSDIGLSLLFDPPSASQVLTRVKLEDNRVAIDRP